MRRRRWALAAREPTFDVSAVRKPAVDIAPVRDPDDEHQQHLVLDPGDDAAVADTHTVEILGPFELLSSTSGAVL